MASVDAERLSFAPAFVVRRADTFGSSRAFPESASIQAAILFADFSGFAPLAAQLAEEGRSGADQLSRILNDYFGRMLGIVGEQGGEPFKFTTDAFFALWPAVDNDLMSATCRAAACALEIQRQLVGYETAEGARLVLRISIAAGETNAIEVGARSERFFVVTGPSLQDATHALECPRPGEVAVSDGAWTFLGPHATANRRAGCIILNDAWSASALSVPSRRTPELMERIGGYVPLPVRAALNAGNVGMLTELRLVSIMSVHVVGLDHLASGTARKLQVAFDATHTLVERYGGVVKEVAVDDVGAVIIATFGLPPTSDDDHALRAIRSAHELHEEMGTMGYAVRIGVATGPCFCGVVGSDVRREYAVVGDAMTLAPRLMTAAAIRADIGGVVCDAATQQAASSAIEFSSLAPLLVKGKSDPVAVYRPGELRRGAGAVERDMIGRSEERATIAEMFSHLLNGMDSGALLVFGGAGVGKTALANDLEAQAHAHNIPVLRSAAEPMEPSAPYAPWRKVFVDMFAAEGREMPAGPQTQSTLFSWLQRVSQVPTVVILENAHWFDAYSWALASEAVQRIPNLFLVLTLQPMLDAPPELAAVSATFRTTTFDLGSVSTADALAIATRRLGVEALPPSIAELVRARTDGNPLFAVELAFALRDMGVLVINNGKAYLSSGTKLASIEVPETLRGTVAARLDRLAPDEQLTIKVASVIGTTFSERQVRSAYPVAEHAERTPDFLEQLRRANLVVVEATEPELRYAFRNNSTRVAAYNLLSAEERVYLHTVMAEQLEPLASANDPQVLAALAHHWTGAGETALAAPYVERLKSAGR